MRKDAEANRMKLILAGRRLMQDEGGDVPVGAICDEAGITRGTFYRNFEDRAALYEEVLDHDLAEMVAALSKPSADPLEFIWRLAEMMIVYDKFLTALPGMDDYRPDGVSEAKITATITPSLDRAKAVGVVADDITGDDVMLACRMITADWRLDRCDDRETAMRRRLYLILRGLSPRS